MGRLECVPSVGLCLQRLVRQAAPCPSVHGFTPHPTPTPAAVVRGICSSRPRLASVVELPYTPQFCLPSAATVEVGREP